MLRRTSTAIFGLMFAASAAHAQGCAIGYDDAKGVLRGVKIYIGKIADESENTKPDEKFKHFKYGLKAVYEDAVRDENQVLRYYMLGKLYWAWVRVDPPKGTVKQLVGPRSYFNLAGDQKAMHDMYMSADSAFTKVEQLNAACTDSTMRYRSDLSIIAYTQAKDALDAKKYDSAVVYARRALVVNPKGAAPWNIIAEASQSRGDTAGYKQALRRVAESGETDPRVKKVREQAMYNLAIMTLTEASKKDQAARVADATEAERLLREYLKSTGPEPKGQAGLASALRIKGDTAAARQMMDDMMKNPDQFTALTLFEAATGEYNASQFENAAKLYELGLKKNPNFRDGVFSLISSYVQLKKFDDAIPHVYKLLTIDPTNVRSYTQAWNVWRGVNNSSTNAALKAIGQDSAIHYGTIRNSAEVSVEMNNDFVALGDSATVSGAVHNRGAAPKSYEVTFEFLDTKGAVVTTKAVTVADVAAKSGKAVAVAVKGKDIVAWRYKPVK